MQAAGRKSHQVTPRTRHKTRPTPFRTLWPDALSIARVAQHGASKLHSAALSGPSGGIGEAGVEVGFLGGVERAACGGRGGWRRRRCGRIRPCTTRSRATAPEPSDRFTRAMMSSRLMLDDGGGGAVDAQFQRRAVLRLGSARLDQLDRFGHAAKGLRRRSPPARLQRSDAGAERLSRLRTSRATARPAAGGGRRTGGCAAASKSRRPLRERVSRA